MATSSRVSVWYFSLYWPSLPLQGGVQIFELQHGQLGRLVLFLYFADVEVPGGALVPLLLDLLPQAAVLGLRSKMIPQGLSCGLAAAAAAPSAGARFWRAGPGWSAPATG